MIQELEAIKMVQMSKTTPGKSKPGHDSINLLLILGTSPYSSMHGRIVLVLPGRGIAIAVVRRSHRTPAVVVVIRVVRPRPVVRWRLLAGIWRYRHRMGRMTVAETRMIRLL